MVAPLTNTNFYYTKKLAIRAQKQLIFINGTAFSSLSSVALKGQSSQVFHY